MLRPFVWGESDCCLAVCNILRDLGWPDPAEGFRGRYADEAGARRIIGVSCAPVAAAVCGRLGWPEVHGELQDGDVGVALRSLAIRHGARWYLKSERGLLSRARADRAWRPT